MKYKYVASTISNFDLLLYRLRLSVYPLACAVVDNVPATVIVQSVIRPVHAILSVRPSVPATVQFSAVYRLPTGFYLDKKNYVIVQSL